VSSFPARQEAFRDVFAVREFRAVWASQILSEAGDRVALVALTILVYDRTGSPLLSAIGYGASYVPWVIGGLVFAGHGDQLPRRAVMVGCDLIRAGLVGAMLIPGIPVAGLVGLLYLTTMAQAPFEAARSAILPDILTGERYALAAAAMQTSFRVALVAGAAAGGVTVALIGARPALGVDLATFVASAVLMRFGTRARPPAAPGPGPRGITQLGQGARLLLGDRAIRTLMMLGWLIALYSIPEGIAAPYAARLGGGPAAAGLLIASGQAGAILAAPVFTKKIGPPTRLRWMGPMACCACAVLPLTAFRPDLAVSMAIFAVSGTFAIYQIAANTAFVAWVPDDRRAQAFGVASSGTVTSQGAALMLAGVAAQLVSPATVIAVAGGVGAVIGSILALQWRHIPQVVGRHSALQPLSPARRATYRGRWRAAADCPPSAPGRRARGSVPSPWPVPRGRRRSGRGLPPRPPGTRRGRRRASPRAAASTPPPGPPPGHPK